MVKINGYKFAFILLLIRLALFLPLIMFIICAIFVSIGEETNNSALVNIFVFIAIILIISTILYFPRVINSYKRLEHC